MHDERAYLLQAEIFAGGHWTAPSPPIAAFFEQMHVFIEPAVFAKYPPGHAVMLVPGMWVGLPGLMPALLAGVAGLLLSGLTNTASVSLAESSVLPAVAAAVIGGTSIMGGRGGYGGAIVGALILTVLTALLTVLGLPEASRQIVFGAIIVVVAAAYTRVTDQT